MTIPRRQHMQSLTIGVQCGACEQPYDVREVRTYGHDNEDVNIVVDPHGCRSPDAAPIKSAAPDDPRR